ncbi:MAG: hypothetical protein RR929_05305 [Erysipelotrichaceae bacterium]
MKNVNTKELLERVKASKKNKPENLKATKKRSKDHDRFKDVNFNG